MTAPCLNCPDRAVGCRIDCEKYKVFRAGLDDRKKQQRKARDKDRIVEDFKVDAINRVRRKR